VEERKTKSSLKMRAGLFSFRTGSTSASINQRLLHNTSGSYLKTNTKIWEKEKWRVNC